MIPRLVAAMNQLGTPWGLLVPLPQTFLNFFPMPDDYLFGVQYLLLPRKSRGDYLDYEEYT